MERTPRAPRISPRATSLPVRAAAMLVFASSPVVACGARSWLPSGDEVGDAAVVDAALPPDVDATPPCVGTAVPLAPRVPNLYFVLDVSGSMAKTVGDAGPTKWTSVRSAVAQLIFELGPSAYFGTTVFPAPSGEDCSTGIEVMPLTLGDSVGVTEATFLRATAFDPRGGTTTAATFRALLPRLTNLDTVTYVILATDGGPNCNAAITSCSVDQCTRNTDDLPNCPVGGPFNCCANDGGLGCLDRDASVAAVKDLAAIGVQTFVMGIPGSAPYAPVLEDLARAGGTARPGADVYYRVDSGETSALGAALADIAEQTMKSCVVKLEQMPKDPDRLNVYVGGSLVPGGGTDGWLIDGQSVTLIGAACDRVQTDAGVPTLQVVEGCQTVR